MSVEVDTQQPAATNGHPHRWHVLAALVVCLLIVMLDNTIMNVALKSIQDDLHATQGQMQWAVNAYSLAFAGLLFTSGVLGDRYGRKWMLFAGLAVFGLASVLASVAHTPEALIAARALMGVGAAFIPAQTLSILTNVFPSSERAKALGIWSAASGLAVAIGPVTGGFLLERWWWGSVFLINAPIVVAGLVLIVVLVPNSRRPDPGHLNPLGLMLSVSALVGLVYGIIRGGETTDWTRLDVLGPIMGGVLLIVLFIRREGASQRPMLDLGLFRDAGFSAATAAVALVMFSLFGLMFFFSYYLQAVRNATPLEAGILLTPAALGILIAAPNTARLVQRFGNRPVCVGAMLLIATGFTAFAAVDRHTPPWQYELLLFALGFGFGAVMASATESMMAAVPRDRAGAGSAVNNAVRMVGGSLGVAVLGSVLSGVYRAQLSDATDTLPSALRDGAEESIVATLTAVSQAARVPGTDPAALLGIVVHAQEAFVTAMHSAALVGAGAILFGVVIVAVWLPRGAQAGQPGEPVSVAG